MIPLRFAVVTTICVLGVGRAQAQLADHNTRRAAIPAVVATNVLLGGVTAATHAVLEGENVGKAFLWGMAGGAVHVGGKFVSTGRAPASGLAGLTVGAVGSSIVVNAGRGKQPLDEIFVPLGPLRLHVTPTSSRKVTARLDAYEAWLVVNYMMVDGLSFDWRRSAGSGAAVFMTRRKLILRRGDPVSGVADGATIVMSDLGDDVDGTLRHELVHVHQHSWARTTLGLPTERWLRGQVRWLRWIPNWLEVGAADRLLYIVDDMLQSDNGPLYRAMQAEAEAFERR